MKVIYKVVIPREKTIGAVSIDGEPLAPEISARIKMRNLKSFTERGIENFRYDPNTQAFYADLICEERYIDQSDPMLQVIDKLDNQNPFIRGKELLQNK